MMHQFFQTPGLFMGVGGWVGDDERTDGQVGVWVDRWVDRCPSSCARLSYEQFDYAEYLGLSTFGLVKVS